MPPNGGLTPAKVLRLPIHELVAELRHRSLSIDGATMAMRNRLSEALASASSIPVSPGPSVSSAHVPPESLATAAAASSGTAPLPEPAGQGQVAGALVPACTPVVPQAQPGDVLSSIPHTAALSTSGPSMSSSSALAVVAPACAQLALLDRSTVRPRKLTRIRSDLRQPDIAPQPQPVPAVVTQTAECDVCSLSPCICTDKVKAMCAMKEASYTIPGHARATWVRYRIDGAKGYIGCNICLAYAAAGHTLHARQSLGRFALREDIPGNHAHDSVWGHIRAPSGDHAKAFEWMCRSAPAAVGEDEPEAAPPKPTAQQENVVYIAYACLREGLSAGNYKALANAAYATGSELPAAYHSHTFYAQVTDCSGYVLFKRVLEAVQRSPVLTVAADEGARGTPKFVIRVHYLDDKWIPQTGLWQVRDIAYKDHKTLCGAIIQSFTQPPSADFAIEDMLTENAFAHKLVGLTADGASVMGTQRGSRPLASPRPGPKGNLAWALQELKHHHGHQDSLLLAWCCPHRLDLVAGKAEDHEAFKPLLDMVRRLSAHVASSKRAQGVLKGLHELFTGEWGGGAEGLHYAPHRFLSHSIPTSKIADSYLEVLEYVYSVSARPANENQRLWVMRILDDLRQFRVWLLLAGAADILEVRMRC